MRRWPGLCLALMLSLVLCGGVRASAQGPSSVAEQYLFNAANAERAQRGLPMLRWDPSLYRAAALHAREMAERESISHQYPGEADLAERAQTAGAHFSVVAENVAEAPTAVSVHEAWMESPGHRENLLDPRVDRIGISVLSRDGQIYAVEDFDRGVTALSFDQQETAVADLLTATAPVSVQIADQAARQTCAMDTGFAGTRRPWFVMRFSTGELDALPDQLRAKLATGKFTRAVVGACQLRSAEPFAGYNIAVLLYP